MDAILDVLPPLDKGWLPLYLLIASTAAFWNVRANVISLHFTRRLYNGRFVPNTQYRQAPGGDTLEDSVKKLSPVAPGEKGFETAHDQITPLAARQFGIYTFLGGLIRFYTAYHVSDPFLYQLAMWVHAVAVVHFVSELLLYKTMRFSGPQIFPLVAGPGGLIWMLLCWNHYVQ